MSIFDQIKESGVSSGAKAIRAKRAKPEAIKAGNPVPLAQIAPLALAPSQSELDNLSIHSDIHGHTNNDISTYSETENAKLMSAITRACKGLDISPKEIKESLAPGDIEEWRQGEIGDEAFLVFAQALVQRREMEQGKCPAHFTAQTLCDHCGLVPIFKGAPASVAGCPWCHSLGNQPVP